MHGAVDSALQITITGKAMVSIFFVVLPLAVFFSAALLAHFRYSRKASRKRRATFRR